MIKFVKFLDTVAPDKWSPGVYIFLTILAILVTIALMLLMGWRFLKEREKNIQEKKAFVEGVMSKSEIYSVIDSTIGKNQYGKPFGVALVDIDSFSQLSNAFGEKIIKDIINTLVKRFIKSAPFNTHIGRIDDDKFVFLFPGDVEIEDILNCMALIRSQIKLPITVTYDTDVTVTASISIATYPRHGRSATKLIESLNIAVYSAKRDGGDRIVLYSEELSEKEGDNLQYYEDVKRGIKNKEFILHYQPIVDINENKVIAAEGLLRWDHSRLGLLNPKDFINILEQSGDIYLIGILGLENLIEQSNAIKQKYPNIKFSLSMNLSPKQLINEKLAVDFQRLLKKYRVQAKDFIIEIEEFLLFEKQENIRKSILKLKELGFRIAVDSFAIDHNTLTRVEKLPTDIIKVDTTVLENESNEIMKNLTEILFTYAKSKNITLVAEKVETLEQVEYLKEHGVVFNQGYLFSKPISKEELYDLIDDDDDFVLGVIENRRIYESYEEKSIDESELASKDDISLDDTPESEEFDVDKEVTDLVDELVSEVEEDNSLEETKESDEVEETKEEPTELDVEKPKTSKKKKSKK